MKLSASNIGWNDEQNEEILRTLKDEGYQGLEIAPTILIKEKPYDKSDEARKKVSEIKAKYGLEISSMQSIWFGKQGNIFNKDEADSFIEYTKEAINFAKSIKCRNLVFGCPKNRNMGQNQTEKDVIYFFKEIGKYAIEKDTTVAIEPNPIIYGTNFINTTKQAFEFVKELNCEGIKVNIDFGTIIQNKEPLEPIYENIDLVNHIHISEPNLEIIEIRKEHKELSDFLKSVDYSKYVSIEMKQTGDLKNLKKAIQYIAKIFS